MPRDNWFLRSICHPNVAGHDGEAIGLLAEAQRLGLKVKLMSAPPNHLMIAEMASHPFAIP